MTKQSDDKYQSALMDPKAVFATPQHVLTDSELDEAQKLEVLRRWEMDARELQVADEEGMALGESSCLDEVKEAMATLTGKTGELR